MSLLSDKFKEHQMKINKDKENCEVKYSESDRINDILDKLYFGKEECKDMGLIRDTFLRKSLTRGGSCNVNHFFMENTIDETIERLFGIFVNSDNNDNIITSTNENIPEPINVGVAGYISDNSIKNMIDNWLNEVKYSKKENMVQTIMEIANKTLLDEFILDTIPNLNKYLIYDKSRIIIHDDIESCSMSKLKMKDEFAFKGKLINDKKKTYDLFASYHISPNSIYDYDKSSIYWKDSEGSRLVSDNFNIKLKKDQLVYIIWDKSVYVASGDGFPKFKYCCESGNLNINIDAFMNDRSYNRNGHYYGTGSNSSKDIVIIELEQFDSMSIKEKKNLFPNSAEEFVSECNNSFTKRINDNLSCIYSNKGWYNNVYVYVDNCVIKEEWDGNIDSLKYIYEVCRYNRNPTLHHTDYINPFKITSNGYKVKSPSEAFFEMYPNNILPDNNKPKSLSEIIERKTKKPIYSKRRG